WQTDLRFVHDDSVVASKCQFSSTTQTDAVYGCNYRKRKFVDLGKDFFAQLSSLIGFNLGFILQPPDLCDVGTGDEYVRLTRCDNESLDPATGDNLIDAVAEFCHAHKP